MKKQESLLGSPIERQTRKMFTRIITGLARMLREQELSVAQVATLHLIDQAGALRVSDLASELALSASATSRLAEALVQRGLVARAEDPADRRAKVLTLTAEGSAFVDRVSEDRVATIFAAAQAFPRAVFERFLSAFRDIDGR